MYHSASLITVSTLYQPQQHILKVSVISQSGVSAKLSDFLTMTSDTTTETGRNANTRYVSGRAALSMA